MSDLLNQDETAIENNEVVVAETSSAEEPVVATTPKKKLTKKHILIICGAVLAAVVLLFAIIGISNSSDSSNSGSSYSNTKIEYSSQAINAVKKYLTGTSFSVEQRIAGTLGFKQFYSPDYGSETAKQNYDGSWEVTLKGKMSGYVDEYHDDFKSYKFEATAKVSEDGKVSSIRVRKAY